MALACLAEMADLRSPPWLLTGQHVDRQLRAAGQRAQLVDLVAEGRAAPGRVVVDDGVQLIGVQVGLGHRDHQPHRPVAAHGHRRDPVRGDRPVLELGGEQLLAGGARAAGGAGRPPRGGVAVGDDVDHAVDRLVVEDLVERAEPGGGVVARHDQEAEPVQSRRPPGAALHHGRADLGHPVGGGTAGEPVGELRLADSGHPGHGDRRVAVPEEPTDPLGCRGQAGEHGAGEWSRRGRRCDPSWAGSSGSGWWCETWRRAYGLPVARRSGARRNLPAAVCRLRPAVLAARGRCGGGRRVPRAPYDRAPPRPRSSSRRAR